MRQPSASEARESVARAAEAKAAVRSTDRLFRPQLIAIAGGTVVLALVVLAMTWLPNWLGPVEGVIVAIAIVGVMFVGVTIQDRQRAYSRAARIWFSATIVVFALWGSSVLQWGFASGWMAYQLPPLVRAWHIALSAVVATIPLLLSALLIGRRR